LTATCAPEPNINIVSQTLGLLLIKDMHCGLGFSHDLLMLRSSGFAAPYEIGVAFASRDLPESGKCLQECASSAQQNQYCLDVDVLMAALEPSKEVN